MSQGHDSVLAEVQATIQAARAAQERAARVGEIKSQLARLEQTYAKKMEALQAQATSVRRAEDTDSRLEELCEARRTLEALTLPRQVLEMQLKSIADAEAEIRAEYVAQSETLSQRLASTALLTFLGTAGLVTELRQIEDDPFVAALVEEEQRKAEEREAELDRQRAYIAETLDMIQADLAALPRDAEEHAFESIEGAVDKVMARLGELGFVDQARAAVALGDELLRRRAAAANERARQANRAYVKKCQQWSSEVWTAVFKKRDTPRAAIAVTVAVQHDGEPDVLLTGLTGFEPGNRVGKAVSRRLLRREDMAFVLRRNPVPVPPIPEERRFWRATENGNVSHYPVSSVRELPGLVRCKANGQIACGVEVRDGERAEWKQWEPNGVPFFYLLPFLRAKSPTAKGSSWAAFWRGLQAARRNWEAQQRFLANEFTMEEPAKDEARLELDAEIRSESQPTMSVVTESQPAPTEEPRSEESQDEDIFAGLEEAAAEALRDLGVATAEALDDLREQPELVKGLVPDHAEEILSWLAKPETAETIDQKFFDLLDLTPRVRAQVVNASIQTRKQFAEAMSNLVGFGALPGIGPKCVAECTVKWEALLDSERRAEPQQTLITIEGEVLGQSYVTWVKAASKLKRLVADRGFRSAIIAVDTEQATIALDGQRAFDVPIAGGHRAVMQRIKAQLESMPTVNYPTDPFVGLWERPASPELTSPSHQPKG
jgi:tRNA(Phe) wybutosine-synthesizing methylase Tyw3